MSNCTKQTTDLKYNKIHLEFRYVGGIPYIVRTDSTIANTWSSCCVQRGEFVEGDDRRERVQQLVRKMSTASAAT